MGNTVKNIAGILAALFLSAFCFAAPSSAQTCNDPSGFLKSIGPIQLGDLATFGPDCQHLQDSGILNAPGIFNPIMFGARCDGSTNDFVALQATLNAAIAANGVMQLPVGTCVSNSSLTIGSGLFQNIIIRGYGGNNSKIKFTGNAGISSTATASFFSLTNFGLACSSTSNTACLLVVNASQSTASGSTFSGLIVSGCGLYGMFFSSLNNTSITNNTILTTGPGGFAGLYDDQTAVPDVGGNLIKNNLIVTTAGVTTNGIYLLNAGGTITSENFISNYSFGIFQQSNIVGGGSTGIAVRDNALDNCGTSCIWFTTSASGSHYAHIVISGNTMHSNQAPCSTSGFGIVLLNGISGVWLFNVSVTGNTVDTCQGSTGINIFSTSGLTVTGNTMRDAGGANVNFSILLNATNGGIDHCTVSGNAASEYAGVVQNTAGCSTGASGGTLAVSGGGTGATTLTGAVIGNGAAPFTAGTLPFADGGTNDTGTSGTAYTPTITCAGGGTLTTISVTGSDFKFLLGKFIYVHVDLTLTNIGSCVGPIDFTLPAGLTSSPTNQMLPGRNYNSGKQATARMLTGGNTARAVYYDNTFALANGDEWVFNGPLETQ